MARLSRYLLRLFTSEAMALFAVALVLLFLIQCLAQFGIVAERGQSLLALLGQAALGMTSPAIVVLYVCLGIGLGRALRGLQERSELQVIHVNVLVGALLRSVFVYALGGSAVLLLLAHLIDPLSAKTTDSWSASIAADLVSRSMVPHRFTEVDEGVSMIIGSRDANGEITDFFADDTRDPASRRTYFAQSAIITRDEQGFVLRMQDGAIQRLSAEKRISQISFARYDLALDELTGDIESSSGLTATSSIDIVQEGLAAGKWTKAQVEALTRRTVEGFRVLAMCLFVASLAMFPNGNRRRFALPLEIVILGAAFIERGITSYAPVPEPYDLAAGPVALAVAAIAVLAVRLRVFLPVRRKAA
jgi:lipopolysaccharide export system permease protein